MKTKLLSALQGFVAKAKQFINDLMCDKYGHQYDTPVFHSKCLYFCKRCGKEMFDRSFQDIEPLTDDEREQMDQLLDEDNRYFTPKK